VKVDHSHIVVRASGLHQAMQARMPAPQELIKFGIVSLLAYGGMTWLSYAFVYGQGHRQRPIFLFVSLYAGLFVFYLLALRTLLQLTQPSRNVLVIVVFAVCFRAALLFSNPIQEDDFYRYLWDGKVVASGLNPYRVAPLAVVEQEGKGEVLQPYTRIPTDDARFALILSRVNHPEVHTIYPPLAQAVFALTALIAPGSLLALRLTFLGFDLGICGLILAVLKHLNASPLWVLVYAWSPLVIKETINSAHYDVVPTFFLMLAVLLALREKSLLAHASLGMAILGKLYPLLLVPVFVWRTWVTQGHARAVLGIGIIAALIVLGYAPFLDAGWSLWQGTLAFAERWQTNSLLFPLLRTLVGERWIANAIVATALGCLVLALLARYDVREERVFLWMNFSILGAVFLLSPVGDPWYFLWLVPFLCVFPFRSWLLLSGLLGLYYLSFYFIYHGMRETFRWVIWLEYVPFYVMLIWELLT
jgi:hypothetical protein